jgi:hypothetical protein
LGKLFSEFVQAKQDVNDRSRHGETFPDNAWAAFDLIDSHMNTRLYNSSVGQVAESSETAFVAGKGAAKSRGSSHRYNVQ